MVESDRKSGLRISSRCNSCINGRRVFYLKPADRIYEEELEGTWDEFHAAFREIFIVRDDVSTR